MNTVRSKIINTSLPLLLWEEALKTTIYILNRASNKVVQINHLDLWIDNIQQINVMKDELESMQKIKFRIYLNYLNGLNQLIVNGFSKPKETSKERQNKIKLDLLQKDLLKNEINEYRETFYLIYQKDSFKILMALVTHFDLELHQMDVKMTFLNGNLGENIYINQLESFEEKRKENLVCKLKKSIYGLRQASQQWYLKFVYVITCLRFIESTIDQHIYMKVHILKPLCG